MEEYGNCLCMVMCEFCINYDEVKYDGIGLRKGYCKLSADAVDFDSKCLDSFKCKTCNRTAYRG